MNGVAQFVEAIFDWTWRSSLYASVLILLVFLVQIVFGKVMPVRWRYTLGLLVLLRLMLPVAPESNWSIFNLSKRFAFSGPSLTVLAVPQGVVTHGSVTGLVEFASSARSAAANPIDWMTAAQMAWLVGFTGSLLFVGWQHWRFAAWVRSLPPFEEDRVSAVLRDCKETMNVRREVAVAGAPGLGTPALFGFCKPRLLLPEGTLGKLDDRELRMVFLHELAHVRRGDTLLNWVMIFVRALHWFNPLVWLAMKRLRADRELVCDSMVMMRLSPGERLAYGSVLIKLLDDFSGAGFCPSLVPVINNKSQIKRRVIMIAKYKSPGRAAVLVSVAVVVALCGFTFTRAAVNGAKPPSKETLAKPGEEPAAENHERKRGERGIGILRERVDQMNAQVMEAEAKVDALRRDLQISDISGEASSALLRLEGERIRAQADYRGQTELLGALLQMKVEKGNSELIRVIPTAVPDELLSRLLQDLAATEATLARLSVNSGPDHPEVKSAVAMQADLNKKADERVEGILGGLRVKAQAVKAQLESLEESVNEARKRDSEMAERYRPYSRLKREVENLQRTRDAIQLRLLQEQVDAAFAPSESERQ